MATGPYNIDKVYRLSYDEGDYSLERELNDSLMDSGIRHTVLEGETLQSIAFKYYHDSGRWADIADFNEIVDPFNINKGDIILIPN